jgi:hypothetical protein
MIGGAAAASFSAVSSGMSTGIAIGSSSAAPAAAAPAAAAPAVVAPAAQAANTTTATAGSPPVPGNAQGCVGFAVSTTTHIFHQEGTGFGDVAHDLGVIPGQVIQAYAASNCGKHQ